MKFLRCIQKWYLPGRINVIINVNTLHNLYFLLHNSFHFSSLYSYLAKSQAQNFRSMNYKSSFIKSTNILLFLGFCFALINAFLNLRCEETGMTNSKKKVSKDEKLPLPGFTIRPFDSSPKANYFFPTNELQSRMKNGKEFPEWFEPIDALKKLTNETYLKSAFGLSWHQVWAIEATCKVLPNYGGAYGSGEGEISCLQSVTFNPPKLYDPKYSGFHSHFRFKIFLEKFTSYAVDFHEPMESNWWITNIDRQELFYLNDEGIRYAICIWFKNPDDIIQIDIFIPRTLTKRLSWTEYKNIDRTQSPCHSTKQILRDKCFSEKITQELGCNLPWKSVIIGILNVQ